ncbi:hypothetical protein MMC25_003661 [Agyrium rufum]|nr:hypothetical protein [Agyrium rufum]
MAKSLSKVTKKINKKKGSATSLHENSRDSQMLRRASARDDKISKTSSMRQKLNKPYLQRLEYFQDAVKESDSVTASRLVDLVKALISRDEETLTSIQAERRPGRPPSSREANLKQRIDSENRELDSGFWIPDLLDEKNLKGFQDWDGKWDALNVLKFVRVGRAATIQESRFPPKGLS